MGAWSYKVLTNDSALDVLDELSHSQDIEADVYNILHGEYNMDEFLLAVEIVDVSLNGIDEDILGGFYGYENWFGKIETIPMKNLIEDAIHVIKFIQKNEEKHNGWVEDVKENRKQLLIKIENRLKMWIEIRR